MVTYQDFKPDKSWTPAKMYAEIENLISGSYSVEVVRLAGDERLFRVWFDQHCDLALHQKV